MPETPETVTLKIGGETFSAWEEIGIVRSMTNVCGGFSLALFDEAAVAGRTSVIVEGAPCELLIGKTLLITGYIDEISQEIDEGRHSIRVTGRDRTQDIVDCSAVHPSGAWKGQKLEAIAADLVKPFGLKITAEADTGAAFARFAIEPGEKVIEALTRLTRMRGLMLRSTPAADLVIYDPSADRERLAAVALGRDVKALRTRSSAASRFSDYTVKGQHRGGNDVSEADAAGPKGEAQDGTVGRYRPLVVISDEQSTAAGCQLRAEWEATTRFGNAVDVSMTIYGWRDPAGRLIEPNLILPVSAGYIGLEEELIVCDVSLSLGSTGTTASLRLVRPEAYTTAEILEARKKKAKGKSGGQKSGMNYLGALTGG